MGRCRDVLSESHPDSLIAVSNLAQILLARGKLADAEPLINLVR